jgi:BspA type Leucine rich repeat region (6 copies)
MKTRQIWKCIYFLWVWLLPCAVFGQFTFATNNSAITITGYTGSNSVVVIPNKTNGLPVTTIGNSAFSGDTNLITVTIPSDVTNVENRAFSGCTRLTGLYFLGNAPGIGLHAFSGDRRAAIYYLPEATGWESRFNGLFGGLRLKLLPYNYAISNETIAIIEYTGAGGAVDIPDKISGLPVTAIEVDAFYYNTSLTSATIPDSVTSIGEGAFLNCFKLTKVKIGNGVTSIGADAFNNTRLNSVTIPASVTNIAEGAFDGCMHMTAMMVDGKNLFFSSTNGVLFDKTQAILIKYPDGPKGNYTIPNSVTNIAGDAFTDCQLTSIAIPNGITSIAENTFYGCTSLKNITLSDSITSIGYDSFSDCTSLRTITIPNSVTNIGTGAFSVCTSLTNVTIANGVSSIGSWAFAGCKLTSISIPSSVTGIGTEAFGSTPSLTSVYFFGNAPVLGPYVFDGATNLTLYYLSGTSGWGSFDGEGNPVVLWNPSPVASIGKLVMQPAGFGFNITCYSNTVVVVEASTNFINPVWVPISTNTFTSTNHTSYFSDSMSKNYPSRFYRLRSQ